MKKSKYLLWLFVGVQASCAIAVVVSLGISILGLDNSGLSWRLREALEVSAIVGLVIGAALGVRAILHARRNQQIAEEALRVASGAFARVVNETFSKSQLTPAEHEVAWMIVKGFPIKDVADLRGTSEGTVKSQCNAIYRKLGVSGRSQLLSMFVEDILLAGERWEG